MEVEQTKIPDEELEVFKTLTLSGVVVDVGAREDIDMYGLRPDLEYHLFEPSNDFFAVLQEKTKGIPNIHINNYGLSHKAGEGVYKVVEQSFRNYKSDGYPQKLRTLDQYCEENNITSIDFLKIDTEGYDFKVLAGAKDILNHTKYIQFEYWDGVEKFHDMLSADFDMYLMMEPVLREEAYRGFQQNAQMIDIFKHTLVPLEPWLITVIDTCFIRGGFGGNVLCIRKP
tara:strand:+ start:48 stop:731 length:684 start_codon:yes stop_codon:yes gene_type:complete